MELTVMVWQEGSSSRFKFQKAYPRRLALTGSSECQPSRIMNLGAISVFKKDSMSRGIILDQYRKPPLTITTLAGNDPGSKRIQKAKVSSICSEFEQCCVYCRKSMPTLHRISPHQENLQHSIQPLELGSILNFLQHPILDQPLLENRVILLAHQLRAPTAQYRSPQQI
mmetsp:Transcript_1099/g.2365  ORF Transcript_1099/g.2365 Transcript_1099/m.2365 type:complete len:169 (+) Transcript_1099:1588-2094(+)